MLTYNFENIDMPIYAYVYKRIKEDILAGILKPDEKLPSKRTFAENNGISTITIQNAYDQLISEGYIYTLPKKGYYVSNIEGMSTQVIPSKVCCDIELPKKQQYEYDLSENGIPSENFPFSIWAKLSREVISLKKEELMEVSPSTGIMALREAIANHLKSFRGMQVHPNQIVVGAGTEYLYGLITQLLGSNQIYAIEDPGYQKLAYIYEQQGVEYRFAEMDSKGVTVEGLQRSGGNVAHICPNHHFPTGVTMPATRRYEILSWTNASENRYIIEDDYDSEFRLEGKPIPTLFSIDAQEKVIYMNTFSKSLSPTIRISYMVLPVHLAQAYYKKMSFYACTVSNFEQYTLAAFLSQGFFEKHINRMRLYYSKQRKKIIQLLLESEVGKKCEILENDSGLHFLIRLHTQLEDGEIERRLLTQGVRMKALSDYFFHKENMKQHYFIINYSNLEEEKLMRALDRIIKCVE